MELAGSGGGDRFGSAGTIDPSSRGDFVDYVVGSFASNRMPVESDVVAYIREEVFVDDKEWEQGVRSGRIDVEKTHAILTEALEATAELADRVGRPTVDMDLAPRTFIEVVEGRWKCPYPFLLC
jgi:hypothetical protein